MISVAIRAMEILQTLETIGTVRDARGLASSTYTVLSEDGVLNIHQPHDLQFDGDFPGIFLMVSICLVGMLTGGMTQAESPE